jgi:hypothetical protein
VVKPSNPVRSALGLSSLIGRGLCVARARGKGELAGRSCSVPHKLERPSCVTTTTTVSYTFCITIALESHTFRVVWISGGEPAQVAVAQASQGPLTLF